MKNLAQEEVLARLNTYFHDDFLNKTCKIIRPDEKYWGAANWSYIHRKEFAGPPEYAIFGYLLITSIRKIQVFFEGESSRFANKRERINIAGQPTAAFIDINSPITEKELRSRQLFEFPLKQLKYVTQLELAGQLSGSSIPVIHIFTGDGYVMYFTDIKAAHEIYGLLTDIINGTPVQIAQVPNLAEQLEKLTDLHRYQVITDEEFEAAKKRLGL